MPRDKTTLYFDLAAGWRECVADKQAPALFAEEGGRLRLLAGDLKVRHDYGSVGPVDCPIAYDPVRRLAFRYVCPAGYQRGDFSQLRAFSVDRGGSYPLKDLPLNQWALWLLEWIDANERAPGQLFGLMATDRLSEDQIAIEHRLFSFKPGEANVRMRLLCRDAYKPLAFSRERRELVFAGADGLYLLNLRGERKRSLPAGLGVGGHGASFCPQGGARVVLGGDGLHLWDLQRNTCSRLTRNGRHPVWAPDGSGIWYRESSADLHYYNFERAEAQKVLGLANQRHLDFWHARPVRMSSCGRYLATSLSDKVLRGVSQQGSATGQRERVYVHNHRLCVLDIAGRALWQRSGYASHMCWVE